MITLLLKNWKLVGFIALIVTVVILTIQLLNYKEKYKLEQRDKENAIKLSALNRASLREYKNKNDNLVTRLSALEFTTSTVKDLITSNELSWLREFEGLKKNMKNLENAYRIQLAASDSMKTKLEQFQDFYINSTGDTIIFQGIKFSHADKYATITGKQVSPDSVFVKYSIIVPVAGVLFWDRKWFLGKKHYKAEITSENPHVQIPEAVVFSVANKLKR